MVGTLKNIRETIIIPKSCRERFLPLDHPDAAPLRDIGITMAGLSDLRGAYRIGRLRPHFYLMLYTLSGSGYFENLNTSRKLMPGDLLVAPADESYGYHIPGNHWRIAWFHFVIHKTSAIWKEQAQVVRHSDLSAAIERAMEGYWSETSARISGGIKTAPEPAARLYADLIALYLHREWEPSEHPAQREILARVAAVWEQVRADLRRPWNVEALAQEAHCSPGHFFRLSRQTFGLSPMEMVTRLRMEHARELLRGTAYPAKQIADWCGYSNPFAFSTAFKRCWGISPRETRRV